MIFVLSSPSGAGKTTVLKILRKKYRLSRILTYTTRPPREGEENGRDYFFCDRPAFRKLIRQKKLAEWALVYGHYYGTPRREIEQAFQDRQRIVLTLDIQGAATIKAAYPRETVLTALLPPSLKKLQQRLRKRRTETGEKDQIIEQRLAEVQKEMEVFQTYDYRIINDCAEKAADAFFRIIQRAEKNCGKPL